MPAKGVGGFQSDLGKIHPTLGEFLHLHGGGELNDSGNFKGGVIFGIDQHTDAQLLTHERELAGIFGIADAGDGVPCAELFGDQTGENIQLVRSRGGDKDVTLVHIGFLLNLAVCAAADDAETICGEDYWPLPSYSKMLYYV